MTDPAFPYDPVAFHNRASVPLDLFYWNGTCEELTSWNLVGGIQAGAMAPILSRQGHSFRLRTADASRRLVFAHTLSDLVIRGCDDAGGEEARAGEAAGAAELLSETLFFEAERDRLRESLSAEMHRLVRALRRGSNATEAADAWAWGGPARATAWVGAAGNAVPGLAIASN